MERYMGTFVRWLLTPVGLFILGLGLYYLMRLFRWEKQLGNRPGPDFPWLFGFLGFTAIPIFTRFI